MVMLDCSEIVVTVQIFTCTGVEMKMVRIKAAEFIFKQYKKEGFVRKDETFDGSIVDMSDINDFTTYYSGFSFIPSIAKHFC